MRSSSQVTRFLAANKLNVSSTSHLVESKLDGSSGSLSHDDLTASPPFAHVGSLDSKASVTLLASGSTANLTSLSSALQNLSFSKPTLGVRTHSGDLSSVSSPMARDLDLTDSVHRSPTPRHMPRLAFLEQPPINRAVTDMRVCSFPIGDDYVHSTVSGRELPPTTAPVTISSTDIHNHAPIQFYSAEDLMAATGPGLPIPPIPDFFDEPDSPFHVVDPATPKALTSPHGANVAHLVANFSNIITAAASGASPVITSAVSASSVPQAIKKTIFEAPKRSKR